MTLYIGLLYSIVLADGGRLTMAPVRQMLEELGFTAVESLLATGNFLFEGKRDDPRAIEMRIEDAFEERFGKRIAIIVRDAAAWRRLADSNPFPDLSVEDMARVAVRVMRAPVSQAERALLESAATANETLVFVAGDPWVHFRAGVSGTRLASFMSSGRVAPGTSRNLNTVRRIALRVEARTAHGF